MSLLLTVLGLFFSAGYLIVIKLHVKAFDYKDKQLKKTTDEILNHSARCYYDENKYKNLVKSNLSGSEISNEIEEVFENAVKSANCKVGIENIYYDQRLKYLIYMIAKYGKLYGQNYSGAIRIPIKGHPNATMKLLKWMRNTMQSFYPEDSDIEIWLIKYGSLGRYQLKWGFDIFPNDKVVCLIDEISSDDWMKISQQLTFL